MPRAVFGRGCTNEKRGHDRAALMRSRARLSSACRVYWPKIHGQWTLACYDRVSGRVLSRLRLNSGETRTAVAAASHDIEETK